MWSKTARQVRTHRRRSTPAGIDAAGVGTWFSEHVPEATQPLSFDLIAGGHSNLTYSVTDGTGETLGAAPSAARPGAGHRARHGPGAPDHLGARAHRRPGPAHHRPVHRRSGQRCARSTSWTSSTAAWSAAPRRPRRSTVERTSHAGESIVDVLAAIHAVDVDAVGLGDLGTQGGLHRAPAQALVRPVPGIATPRYPAGSTCRRCTRCTTRSRRTIPAAGPGHDRPRRLPARQLHARRTTARSSRSSTGRSARSAIPSPTSDCCASTGPTPTSEAVLPQAAPTALEGFPRKRRAGRAATPSVSGRDLSAPRLLRRVRLLEADLHHRRRLRPLRRRRDGRRPAATAWPGSGPWSTRLAELHRRGTHRHREPTDDRRPPRRRPSRPELHEPVLIVALDGWIDAGLGAANAMSVLLGARGHRDRRRVRRRPAARPPGPPPGRCTWSTASSPTSTWPAIELRAGSRRRRQRRAAADRRRARLRVAGLRRGGGRAGRRPTGAAWSSASGAYPAPVAHTRDDEPVGHHVVDRAVRPAARLRARHARRARRHPRRARRRPATRPASPRSGCGRRCRTTSRPCRIRPPR